MNETLDQLMERASQMLVRMDYLTCEALCLKALAMAREQEAWAYYARILLPLQEARRQRRMIAADGTIRLGTASLEGAAESWLSPLQAGCIVVTRPHKAEDALALDDAARHERHHVEVLYADTAGGAETWSLQSFRRPKVRLLVAAPPRSWQDLWLAPGERPEAGAQGESESDAELDPTVTPADWFIDATEQLGDAALEQVPRDLPPRERLAKLEQMLEVVSDHELLHQALGDAARALR